MLKIAPAEILTGLTALELRQLAKKDERTTVYGSAAYVTRIRNRSAKFTEIVLDQFNPQQEKTISELRDYVKGITLIRVDRQMGLNPEFNLHCRSFISSDYARIAYLWHETLFPCPEASSEPDITVIVLPEWPERKVIVDAVNSVTYILGSDYAGELKKANLRLAMYLAKKRGLLGLHAAGKILRIYNRQGKLEDKGLLLFGLSGTGKTSLTCHPHNLSGAEGIVIRQDDVVFLSEQAFALGSENNFYLKTEGLEPVGQPLLYKAATSPRAILENVWVEENGKIDFFNYTYTSNGRGIVYRSDMDYTDDKIDLAKVDIVIFITRKNDILPPVARLTPEQGAAFFMLGESVETSAGDPKEAGKSLRVVGTNPFIIGSLEAEGNRFYSLLKQNPQITCYLLNTGFVGGKTGEKITITDSSEIIKQIAREAIEWETDPDWAYQIPKAVAGLELARFSPGRFYSPLEYADLTRLLKEERSEYLKKFPGLSPEILKAI